MAYLGHHTLDLCTVVAARTVIDELVWVSSFFTAMAVELLFPCGILYERILKDESMEMDL